jgi:putative DNA primase/helicase
VTNDRDRALHHPDAYALDNVPQSLRSLPQWVVWRLESRRDCKTKKNRKTKVPYHLTDDGTIALAATNDPATWMTYAKARKLFEDADNKLSGIGFVLTAVDSFVGFDFDDCLHEGRIIGPAAEWVRRSCQHLFEEGWQDRRCRRNHHRKINR